MAEDAAFFVKRGGDVWACWPDGRPAVRLGSAETIATAMRYHLDPTIDDEAVSAAIFGSGRPAQPQAGQEALREEVTRQADRHYITIFGRVMTPEGSRDITVKDLSAEGCRFHDKFSGLKKEAQVSLKIGPVGPIVAFVRWRSGEYVGVEFEKPLYPSVLEHIRAHFDRA